MKNTKLPIRATVFFSHDLFDHSEKLMTLGEFVALGRLVPGQHILVGDIDERDRSCNTQSIWIGNATPFIEPCELDAGIGWDESNPLMQKFVIEVNTFE